MKLRILCLSVGFIIEIYKKPEFAFGAFQICKNLNKANINKRFQSCCRTILNQ